MAYRNDYDALAAQCHALRTRLASAEEGTAELERLRAELEDRLAALERARLSRAERENAAVRAGRRGLGRGVVLGLAAMTLVFIAVTQWPEVPHELELASEGAWFRAIKPRCNPVEVDVAIRGTTAPDTGKGNAYLATCYALAGRINDAKEIIDSLPQDQRGRAANTVFGIAHPIADAGDDKAAGPIMEMVLRYTPENYQAVYHAGMSAYALDDMSRAKQHLERFLTMYHKDDGWQKNAKDVLARLRKK